MTGIDADCVIRIKAYLRKDGFGEIHGPSVEGQNGHREIRQSPEETHRLVGQFEIAGSYFPWLPYGLIGEQGIETWFREQRNKGFFVRKINDN